MATEAGALNLIVLIASLEVTHKSAVNIYPNADLVVITPHLGGT